MSRKFFNRRDAVNAAPRSQKSEIRNPKSETKSNRWKCLKGKNQGPLHCSQAAMKFSCPQFSFFGISIYSTLFRISDFGFRISGSAALGQLGVGLITLLLCLGCNRLPGKPTPADIALTPEQVTNFTVLYQQNCSGCHGQDGRGNGALALNNPILLAIADDEALRQATASGVPGTPMPAFLKSAGGTLTDQQVDILVREMRAKWSQPAEVGSNAPPPYAASTPGDASHGAEVYVTFCASCHGSDGNGTGRASSIVNGSYLALVSDQDLRILVIAGRPDLHHPDWRNYVPGRVMTAQEVTDVVAWLGSKRSAYPGQPYPEKAG